MMISPIFGSKDPSTSWSNEEYQTLLSLSESTPRPYGVGPGPGSSYSLKGSVLASNRAMIPALYSATHTVPLEPISRRRGRMRIFLGFGGFRYDIFSVVQSTLPI